MGQSPDDRLLATGLLGSPHIEVIDRLAAERLGNVDAAKTLVYLFETVAASALPHLAVQLNVDGNKGFWFAETDDQRRDVVMRSIRTNRLKGTRQSIRDIVQAAGYVDIVFVERLPSHWADFYAVIKQGQKEIDKDEIAILIDEYKPARSILLFIDVGDLIDGITGEEIPDTAVRGEHPSEIFYDVYAYGNTRIAGDSVQHLKYRGREWPVETVDFEVTNT